MKAGEIYDIFDNPSEKSGLEGTAEIHLITDCKPYEERYKGCFFCHVFFLNTVHNRALETKRRTHPHGEHVYFRWVHPKDRNFRLRGEENQW